MRCAALKKTELNASNLFKIEAFFEIVGKLDGQSSKLGMTEPVGSGGFCLGHKRTVRVMESFGYGNKDIAFLLHDLQDVIREPVKIKVSFGEIDEIRAASVAVFRCECCRGREPSCVTSHDLYDRDHICIINIRVLAYLHA